MALKYSFKWGDEIYLPVSDKKALKIERAYSKDYGNKANLVCPYCLENFKETNEMRQYYECERGHKYTIGEIDLRQDKDSGIVFSNKALRQFLKETDKKIIEIKEAIDLNELIKYKLFLEDDYEIFSDDTQYSNIIKKIYAYLNKNSKALMGKISYRGEWRGCVIYPSDDRLVLTMLRDARLIKEAKMDMDIKITNDKFRDKLIVASTRERGMKYYEFLEMVKDGKEIKIEHKKEEDIKIPAWLEAEAVA